MEKFLDENAPPDFNQIASARGKGIGSFEQNPLEGEPEPVSPEEQKEYDELFPRVMAMIHDTRGGGKAGKKSMADSIIKAISSPGLPAYEAIGKAAGNIMRLTHENAKRQKVEFSGDVLREVGMDVIVELIDIARELNAVEGIPDDESPQMKDFANQCALEATKLYGEYLLSTGQADVEGEKKDYLEQMEREATSGALDDWNMEGMNPELIKQAQANKQGFA